jgi:hypothetical protein
MLTVSVSYLKPYTAAEATLHLDHTVTEPGVYRFVYERGRVDSVELVTTGSTVDVSGDIDRDGFFLSIELEEGILVVDGIEDTAPAQYMLVA